MDRQFTILFVIGTYMLAMIVVGLYYSRKNNTVSDYVIDYRFAAGTHTLTVQEPTLLNGLTVVVSGSEQRMI